MGTASGHMCFWMEKIGADVFAYDLSPYDDWDIVPYFNNNLAEHVELRRRHLGLINNSFGSLTASFLQNLKYHMEGYTCLKT